MVLNLKKIGQIFKHSKDFEQGRGNIRKGMSNFVVALDGSGDFDDIKDAINSLSSTGGSIYIKEGTYIFDLIILPNKPLKLAGTGFATILKSSATGAGILGFIDLSTNNPNDVILDNLNIDGSDISKTGIFISSSSNVRIENCWVHNFIQVGILSDGGISRNTIQNCKIYSNGAGNAGEAGIWWTNRNAIIINNWIYNNNGEGIEVASDFCLISGNDITGNSKKGISLNAVSDKNRIIGNYVVGNTTGQIIDAGSNNHQNGASGTTNLTLDDLIIIA